MNRYLTYLASIAFLFFAIPVFAETLDEVLENENASTGLTVKPLEVVDDLGFARRVCLDLAGRIPTGAEIATYLKWPRSERRAKLIDRYMQDAGFANRWSAFFADMLRIRSSEDGGTAFLAFVHNAVQSDMPYDEMCRRLISASGKAGRTPEVGFVLGDEADPMALASTTSQVFMGVRISCAQCHDHPFDKWTREDFYAVAAFFGKTRRMENDLTNTIYTTEDKKSRVMWPPEDESEPAEREPMSPRFPLAFIDDASGLSFVQRFERRRAQEEKERAGNIDGGPSIDDLLASASTKAKKRLGGGMKGMPVSMEAKQDIRKIDVNADLYRQSELRTELARMVTDPRNRFFARSIVNRAWKELMGRAFVDPVDDFRDDNPPSHPLTMDYLAEEFVAGGFSFRWLVREIVSSDAYGRAHVPLDADEVHRAELETAFYATPMRRMNAEALYDSIITAGHLFAVKHPPGQNPRTIRERVRVAVAPDSEGETSPESSESEEEMDVAMMDSAMPASAENYGLEKAIELDFASLLNQQDNAPMVDSMKMVSREEIEAERMKLQPRPRPGMKYTTKMVERTIDDNPRFGSAYRMATPAPPGHFLRLFGQPARVDLGDNRFDNASMRQALLMLNGQLTNQAARVGQLEPVYKMLVGSDADLPRAIRYTYGEILTRMPSAAEVATAKSIIYDGEDVLSGMADFRWILLNSNEFRFVP